MTKIKETVLDYKSFKNILAMFTSSSSEDFFLAIKIWHGCKKNITLNTIIARRIGKTEYKEEREMHRRLLEFTKLYNIFHLDESFHNLINKMREEILLNDTLSIRLIKEEVKHTVNTLIDYHNLLDIVKLENKNIKI